MEECILGYRDIVRGRTLQKKYLSNGEIMRMLYRDSTKLVPLAY